MNEYEHFLVAKNNEEFRNGSECDCCKVFLPEYEASTFIQRDQNGDIIKKISGHENCVAYEAGYYK